MNGKPCLILDNRRSPMRNGREAGPAELEPTLTGMGFDCRIDTLPYGDVAFDGQCPHGPGVVGIERKKLWDVVECMRDGRLAGHQLVGMIQHYDWSYLIVEANSRENPASGVLEVWRRDGWTALEVGPTRWFLAQDIESYLTTLESQSGPTFRIRRTHNVRETCQEIRNLHHWWSGSGKAWGEHGSLKVIYDPPPPVVLFEKPSLARRWANQLSGIGWEKSAAVARHFRTARAMADAEIREWTDIPGIGKGIATKAYREIRGEQ